MNDPERNPQPFTKDDDTSSNSSNDIHPTKSLNEPRRIT